MEATVCRFHVRAFLAGVGGDTVDVKHPLLEQFVGAQISRELVVAGGVDRVALATVVGDGAADVRCRRGDGLDDCCDCLLGFGGRNVE